MFSASIITTILGLILFEVINSIDNAIINAEVLSTMQPKSQKWFLFWGIIFGVFVVRGLLPWIIIWATIPSLGPIGAFTATFSSDASVVNAVQDSSPILLAGGGMFLVLLFFHWLFLEDKEIGLPHEHFLMRQGGWFYAIASIILAVVVWFALHTNPLMAFGTVIGSTAFFITHGFKQFAEQTEKEIQSANSNKSDISKIMYLEVIDATFSIDGVLGAFAFTLSIPIILIGNGIGAIIVRQLTISNIDQIRKYVFLKNGAMYSIAMLGCIMILDAFGAEIPAWFSPLITFIVVGFFFYKSTRHKKALRI